MRLIFFWKFFQLVKRDEIASFLNDFDILAHARGSLPTPAK